MNFRYIIQELNHRRRRTIISIIGLSIGIALLLILNSLSLAYREVARAPLREIGADITIQRSGNVPKKLAGTVFPCSAVTIKKDEVKWITRIPGVSGVGKAVLLWQFDPHHAWIILGIERENPVGPAILHKFVTEGRFFEEGKIEAMIEKSYAYKSGIHLGDKITVAGQQYPVVGIVDASNAPKIALANLYLPIQEAQRLAAASQLLQSVSPFTDEDINLLFIKVDQSQIVPITTALKNMLGNKTTIATPESFLKLLGNMLFMSDKFTMAASIIAVLVAMLITFKTMAGNLAERVREI
ncbi:MAG: ABC transporter permease, partial [Smithella sp.]